MQYSSEAMDKFLNSINRYYVMSKIFAVLGLILVIFLGLFAIKNFDIVPSKSDDLAENYMSFKEAYEIETKKSNLLIEKYNNDSILTFDRIDIVDEYFSFCKNHSGNLYVFEKFIINNSRELKELGLKTPSVLLEIDSSKKAMMVNKLGMKKDLIYIINNSPIISYNKEKLVLAKELVNEI